MLKLTYQFLLQFVQQLCVYVMKAAYYVDNKASKVEHDRFHDHDEHGEDENEDGPPDLDSVNVNLQQIYFGQLVIECPQCEYETEEVGMGMTTIERPETDEQGLPEMIQIGIVSYPCGHTVHGPALLDDVAKVLNAKELGHLTPKMIQNLQESFVED